LNTELIKTVWKNYADTRGFIFETRDRNIALAGRKTELIIRVDDTLKIRGVFQLDINGLGQGRGTLNKTTVKIAQNDGIALVDSKANREKFGYKKCYDEKDTLTFEYTFLFESSDSFKLLDELFLLNNINV